MSGERSNLIRRKPWTFYVTVLALALPWTSLALDPSKAISQYARAAWTIEDGLPQSSVQAILQTRRGDLWIGTQGGLVRFDGMEFEVFDRSNTPAINSNYISCLSEDREGRLWIGTHGGVLRFEAGTAGTLGELTSDPVTSILAAADGTVWIGTRDAGLYHWTAGELSQVATADGLADDRVMSLAAAGDDLWVGTRGGLSRLTAGGVESFTTADGLASDIVGTLHVGRDGSLWAGTAAGLSRFAGGAFTTLTTADGLPHDTIWALAEDPDGNLWIASGGGLSRLAGGRIATAAAPQGLPTSLIRKLHVDREGGLWVGTFDAGLLRLDDGAFTTWGVHEGLANDTATTVLEDRAGDLWIGTFGGGLDRLAGGRVRNYSIAEGLVSNQVWSLAEDTGGDLWIGTYGAGLQRLADGRFEHFTTADGLPSDSIKALLAEPDGGLLIGTARGVTRRRQERFLPVVSAGHTFDHSTTSLLRSADGESLWIGSFGNGLSRIRGGAVETFTTADGLPSNTVYALHEDATGTLWISTQDGGLGRLRDSRFAIFTSRDGLLDDTIHSILEDGAERLWLSSNKGIFHLDRTDLEAFAAGSLHRLRPVTYGTEDGLKSREASGGSQPAGWRGRDGRLWFPTTGGVSAIDPDHLVPRSAPAPLLIERILADGRDLDLASGTVAPAGAEKLEIHYAALSFRAPEKVRYRYRLEGFEPEWVEAGSRRQAFYTKIPPGSYRFAVSASHDGTAWSEPPAAVALTLSPRYYQTRWFLAAVVLAAGLAGYGVYRLRIRQLKRSERELARRVAESLAQIKVLRGMLPICSSCKSIRDDRGYWNQLESYLSRYSQAELSHALCPSCATELYPELAEELLEQQAAPLPFVESDSSTELPRP